jgi:Berberine and berberine like
MLNFDEMDRVVEALGGPEKYAMLGRVKAQYDPENLFQMNYSAPARAAASATFAALSAVVVSIGSAVTRSRK